ncbi:lmo0937 family membrane protein [Clostridium psychrophilum]|nr:lmo0937 family membrane protein [Clostridium psychrophilum]MBU3182890.1 lmo0937 family membrane protein [Clostridium psychrophilum]
MGILRWLAVILIIFWLLGLGFNIGGGLIHILIVIAVIVFIFDIIGGRR